jgi:ferric-dicitrate binding protein FerR (iron transport regulator)
VTSHVKPHRWADAARGMLAPAAVQSMDEHAAGCARCARQRERVMSSINAFGDIAGAEAPPLRWEHIGARIYWITSSERRNSQRGTRPRRARWAGAALLAAAGVAAIAYMGRSGEPAGARPGLAEQAAAEPGDAVHAPAGAVDAVGAEAPAPGTPLGGLITFLQGEVSMAGSALGFDDLLVQGHRITTGAGKIAVQFDRDSGFTLAENSSLELRAFDQRRVELVVEGSVVVDITRRAPEQTFVVVAGRRQIHVRGTSFAVHHRGDHLRVACGHGEVAVVSASGEEVAALAGQVLQWEDNVQRAGTLDLDAVAALQREVFRVPAWTGAGALRDTSSTLVIAASARQSVEIDGVVVGAGSFSVRVMPGRHHVRAEGVPGTWLELDPGAAVKMAVRAQPPSQPAAVAGQRRGELEAAIADNSRVHTCVRALDKQGVLEGAYIILDIGILRDGTVAHLNIVDTNLGRSTARCVRDMVDMIDFAPGPAATVQHRIAW